MSEDELTGHRNQIIKLVNELGTKINKADLTAILLILEKYKP
jgi:hypothetical protein